MMTLTSTQIGQLVAQFFLAGAGTLSFAVLFACPKRTLPCCALVGAVGWFVYELAVLYGADAAAASLIAVIPLSLAARICAVLFKTPVTVFLLTGIFPLVPGAGIYYTAYYFIQGENALSLANGISTFKVAVVLAVGIALVFRAGATTGGTDILVRLLKLRYKHIETGKLFFCTDLVVVICSMVVFHNVNTGLYALLSIMVFAIVFDVVLYGSDTAKMVYVVSEKEERIARRIMDELEIGVTYVHGQGAYTEKEKRVILCAAKKQLFPKVKEIVKEEDPQAFLIVSSASDIYGEGFKDHFAEEF